MDNPKITKDELKMIGTKIEHLVRFAACEKGLRKSESGELYGVNGSPYNNLQPIEKAEDHVLVREVEMQFRSGGPKFNPTVAEIVSQIPTDLLFIVSAYEIASTNTQKAKILGGCMAIVFLYRRKK